MPRTRVPDSERRMLHSAAEESGSAYAAGGKLCGNYLVFTSLLGRNPSRPLQREQGVGRQLHIQSARAEHQLDLSFLATICEHNHHTPIRVAESHMRYTAH